MSYEDDKAAIENAYLKLLPRVRVHDFYSDDRFILQAAEKRFEMSTTDDSQSCIEAIFSCDRDGEYEVEVNIIVVNKEDRGKGIGLKLVDAFVSVLGDRIITVKLIDQSKGFWKKMQEVYPKINWDLDNDDFEDTTRVEHPFKSI